MAVALPTVHYSASRISSTLNHAYAGVSPVRWLMAIGRAWIAPIERVVEEIPNNARHLDMGCGGGFLLSLSIALRGAGPVVGVDVDDRSLAVARKVIRRAAAWANVRLATMDDWRKTAESGFDVATLVDVLHHVPWAERKGFLEDLMARVRPGGRFIYKDIAQTPRWMATANFLHDLILSGDRVRLTPIAEVEALAAAQGFILTKSEKLFRLWYAHDLRVFEKAA
jgi:2-polyprenyl-3-methyl-5-hydroxy-6-metoxy-1,4-benzoquinol methylase